MQLNYRSKKDKDKMYCDVKRWLEDTLDTPAEEIGAFFEKRSDGYDKMRKEKFLDEYKIIPDYLPDYFDSLLDIGCGSGFEFNAIFDKYPAIKVTGIDFCKNMLDLFKQNFGDKDIELIEADYFKYPFEEKQYDVVLSVQSLHHFKFEKKKELYRKIYNATKVNGFYYEVDYMAQDEEFEQMILKYYEKKRKMHSVHDDAFVHIDIPLTIEHQIELLKYVGFREVTILNKPFLKGNTVYLKAVK